MAEGKKKKKHHAGEMKNWTTGKVDCKMINLKSARGELAPSNEKSFSFFKNVNGCSYVLCGFISVVIRFDRGNLSPSLATEQHQTIKLLLNYTIQWEQL